MTEPVRRAEAAILETLKQAGGGLKPSALIDELSQYGSFTEADVVEAVWRLRQKKSIEIGEDGVVRELVAA